MKYIKNLINYACFYLGYINIKWIWLSLLIGIIIFFVLIIFKKKYKIKWHRIFAISMLMSYGVLIVSFTLLNRKMGESYQYKIIPFWSYIEYVKYGNKALIRENLHNVYMFLPFGAILPVIINNKRLKKVIVICGLSSVIVELIQLFFKLGLFEFDDIFHNTCGAIIGYCVYLIASCILKEVKEIYKKYVGLVRKE